MEENSTKKRLQSKLKKKKNLPPQPPSSFSEDNDFMKMLSQVNKILKTNPEMINKVSKCVESIMDNKSLMESLISNVESNIAPSELEKDLNHKDQILTNNSLGNKFEAILKESRQ